jgi:hypothetical protein
MEFNLQNPQPIPDIDYSLKVGNVYPSKNTRKTKYWIVVSLHDGMAHMFGLDGKGNITQAVSYGQHVFNGVSPLFKRGDDLCGFCQSIQDLKLDITWY